jgi:tRNA(adenine34) deaminase
VYGASDEKNGCISPLSSLVGLKSNWPFHPKTTLVAGLLKEESAGLMKAFFKKLR